MKLKQVVLRLVCAYLFMYHLFCLGQKVNGIGSTLAANVYLRWISAYKATRNVDKLQMTYSPEGSGAGKAAMQTAPGADQPMAYGASDMPLTDDEFNNFPDLQTFPTMAG